MTALSPGDSARNELKNELSGVVHGSAVQAGSIHGGVHFTVARPAPGQLPGHQMPAPAQLPVAPAHFTGRSPELADLRLTAEQLDPVRRLAVVVVSGPGGAGKTALAAHWLHRISGQYDGGALYADLHGHIMDAATPPGDVLTGFLAALGTPPDRIPVDLDDQAKLYPAGLDGSPVPAAIAGTRTGFRAGAGGRDGRPPAGRGGPAA
jgi:hypothetical protein